jgi:hypothetical protein
VESRIFAPAGLFATAEERTLLAAAGNGARFTRDDTLEPTTTGGGP